MLKVVVLASKLFLLSFKLFTMKCRDFCPSYLVPGQPRVDKADSADHLALLDMFDCGGSD